MRISDWSSDVCSSDLVATSVIQDGDINNALDAGSSVRITTGDPGAGAPGDGNITIFEGVEIVRSIGTAPMTFQLDAHRAIFGADFSTDVGRSEERRGGKEWLRTCESRGWPYD